MSTEKLSLIDLIRKVVYRQSERCGIFAIDELNYVDQDSPVSIFEPNASYFRIRLNEYYLRKSRELWKSYFPLALSLVKFSYNGRYEEIPYVVGPELIKSLDIHEVKDYINFRNVKLVGPSPYIAGDVSLFLGLMRVEKNDWAKQFLSFVENLSSSLALHQLSICLNIVRPMTEGLEKLLAMGQRIYPAELHTYRQPAGALTKNMLRPCTVVIIGKPEHEINPKEFWLKEGRLFYGLSSKSLQPYVDADYLMYSIEHQTHLEIGELNSMNFYQKHWKKVKELSMRGQAAAAFQELTVLLSSISSSPDLTQADQLGLLIALPGLLNKYLANYKLGLEGVLDSLQGSQRIVELGDKLFHEARNASDHLNLGSGASVGIQKARDYFVSQIATPTKSINGDDDLILQAMQRGRQLLRDNLSPDQVALGLYNLRPPVH